MDQETEAGVLVVRETMGEESRTIYCAGPLFNPAERDEMERIAEHLEQAGYRVFLPHRDGLEFARVLPVMIDFRISEADAIQILNRAIFALDVYQIVQADGLVLNVNGRVPDEGAMVEAGIAWSHDKEIVLFKSDTRSLIEGECNPLVMGLTDFEFVDTYAEISPAFDRKFAASRDRRAVESPSGQVKLKGEKIAEFLVERRSQSDLAHLLVKLFGDQGCQTSREMLEICS
jgi:nucleoside 2-deoxyribosyltransferase